MATTPGIPRTSGSWPWALPILATLWLVGFLQACAPIDTAVPTRPFAELDLQRTSLVFILDAHDCHSCIDTALPFFERTATSEHVWDRRLVLLSRNGQDPTGYGERLGLTPHMMTHSALLDWSGAADFTPMMVLLTADHRLIAARPLTFAGHDVDAVFREFEQLAYEYGTP